MHFVIMRFKDIYFCQIEIIKGLTDKGQFHKIKGASRGDLPVYNTIYFSKIKDQYFIINHLIPSWDHFIAPVRKSQSPNNDCPFDLPRMTLERVIMSGTTSIAHFYVFWG